MALKLLVGIAQPQRQVAGAGRASRAGIRNAPVIGRWRITWRPPRVELELGFVPGRLALELVGGEALSEPDQRRASAAVGRVVARLAAAGLFNRDVKLSNLIVDDDKGAMDVCLIDTVGLRRMRHRIAEIARMLERLAVQPARSGQTLTPPVWIPAMRHALRELPATTRRAVVRQLQAHRQREYV
jgi:hypothetical protein